VKAEGGGKDKAPAKRASKAEGKPLEEAPPEGGGAATGGAETRGSGARGPPKVVQIDWDTKMRVLTRDLKERRKVHVKNMIKYRADKSKADQVMQEQLEFERVRAQFSVQMPGADGADKVKELEAAMEAQGPKKPHHTLLVARSRCIELICEVLLATADKVSRGEEVDDVSVIKKNREQQRQRQAEEAAEGGETSVAASDLDGRPQEADAFLY